MAEQGEGVAWVSYWTAFLEHDADPLDSNWYVEVYADGCWKILDWLGEEKATGQEKSAAAAKTKSMGAFARFMKWHKAALFRGAHLGYPMLLYVQIGDGGYRWQASLMGNTYPSVPGQSGTTGTLKAAKAAAEAAAPNLVAAANRAAEEK